MSKILPHCHIGSIELKCSIFVFQRGHLLYLIKFIFYIYTFLRFLFSLFSISIVFTYSIIDHASFSNFGLILYWLIIFISISFSIRLVS